MSVDVSLVKKLRDATYASLKDCKAALEENNGDLDAATQWLVKKGVSNAAKKADRELNDGQVKVVIEAGRLTVFKIGCETDFVAKNEMFSEMVDKVASILTTVSGSISSITDCSEEIISQVQEVVSQYIAKLGENIQLVDVYATDLGDMNAASYLHLGGKIAAVVMYRNGSDAASAVAKQVAMQIAAMNPQYMTMDEIPTSEIEAKREEFGADLKAAGKPEAMIAQIVDGKINKYYADLVLMNQGYIGDETLTISKMIDGVFEFAGARRFSI